MGFLTYGLLCPFFPWASLAHLSALGFRSPFTNFVFSWAFTDFIRLPDPITSYSSSGFMGLPSIPYSLYLHCFGPAAAHSYFFHITHCPWVCYSLFLSFRALLSPFAFSMPIYLFHGPVIHYFCRLDLMVFFCSLSLANFSVLLSWALFLTFGFHKKIPSTFSPLNICSAPAAYM